MKFLKASFPILLLFLFEVAVGVFLFTKPESFTKTVIVLFGAVLLIAGIVYLVRYFVEKKKGEENVLSLIVAVVSLCAGIFLAFFPGLIMGIITVMAVIYGVILIVSGIYKIQNYIQDKKVGLPVSKISLLSGILAILLGIVVILFPEGIVVTGWRLTGIAMIVEAVADLVSAIMLFKIVKTASSPKEKGKNG